VALTGLGQQILGATEPSYEYLQPGVADQMPNCPSERPVDLTAGVELTINSSIGSRYTCFSFNLVNPSAVLAYTADSETTGFNVDPVIEISSQNDRGNILAFDDDGAGGLHSRLDTYLASGSYVLRLMNLSNEVGNVNLVLSVSN